MHRVPEQLIERHGYAPLPLQPWTRTSRPCLPGATQGTAELADADDRMPGQAREMQIRRGQHAFQSSPER
jgi:hypothetical protein